MVLSDTRRLKKIRSRKQEIEKRILQEDRRDARPLNHQQIYMIPEEDCADIHWTTDMSLI